MRLLEFELSNYFWFILFVIHSLHYRGIPDTIKIFGIGLIYGGLCESYGIWAGYFKELNYLIYIPGIPAPLATMIGWTIVYYFTSFIVEKIAEHNLFIESSPLIKSILAGVIATSFDFMIDPIAVKAGWWIWAPKFKPFFLGVPLVNFVAWFFAVSVWIYFCYKIEESYSGETLKIIKLLVSIPFIAFIAGSLTFGFMRFINTINTVLF